MIRHRKPPSQTWRTFLDNHLTELASIDFFTLPTASFRILYVFLVLRHARRELVHFNVTEHPTAQWSGQQLVEAFPWDPAPQILARRGGWRATRLGGGSREPVPVAPARFPCADLLPPHHL